MCCFPLRANGALVGEVLVEPAEEIAASDRAYFIADHRGGSRLALAVANPSNNQLSVWVVVVSDSNNSPPSAVNTTVDIPANSAKSFFLDEVGTIPEDHVGLVRISAISAGHSVYAIGLKVTGAVFTTISGNGDSLNLHVTGPPTRPKRCTAQSLRPALPHTGDIRLWPVVSVMWCR